MEALLIGFLFSLVCMPYCGCCVLPRVMASKGF
jgi:hypothetical protein